VETVLVEVAVAVVVEVAVAVGVEIAVEVEVLVDIVPPSFFTQRHARPADGEGMPPFTHTPKRASTTAGDLSIRPEV